MFPHVFTNLTLGLLREQEARQARTQEAWLTLRVFKTEHKQALAEAKRLKSGG